ncbi:radical SAM/Cys-rich domain protein [bacterium]|nr:radical SAM/Cys-rich domain protein [bacterium]
MTAAFSETIKNINPAFTSFDSLKTLQVNLGNLCNLACAHCHVAASPSGKKSMGRETAEKIVAVLETKPGITLDLTGGCPEMNPNFAYLIEKTDRLSPRRIVRSNLAILTEPGMEWLPGFYREHRLTVCGSLPCYSLENVEKQRGTGVFSRSITALKRLNALGYGTELELNLVYNPGGPFLPGPQRDLEAAYRKELSERFGVVFTSLFTITNAPIGRFRDYLEKKGAYESYLNLLSGRFNPDAAGAIMCRSMVSVDWQGLLYNCDFNQALGLPIRNRQGQSLTIDDLEEATRTGTELMLGQHCYCCTAGEGSSCTGSLAA